MIEKSLYPNISASFANVGAEFPEFLATSFERILQRIELFWGEKEAFDYIDSLLLDEIRENKEKLSYRSDHATRIRQGFPIEAMNEILLIKQVHQLLYPSTSFDPYDPFSGSEIAPINKLTKSETQLNRLDDKINHKIDWPILGTQIDLIKKVMLQHSGEQVYPVQGKPIGEILMHYGVIDENTLRIVINMKKRPVHKNRPLGEILVDIGIINQDELNRALFLQTGILMVDILSIDIPADIYKTVPYSKTREKLAIPIGHYRDTLYLAVSDPFLFMDHSFFTMMTRMKIALVYAPLHEIVIRINSHGMSKRTVAEPTELPKHNRHSSLGHMSIHKKINHA